CVCLACRLLCVWQRCLPLPLRNPILFPLPPFPFWYAATPQMYALSLHDALPICEFLNLQPRGLLLSGFQSPFLSEHRATFYADRSEEHTSELQSRENLVCRLLLEKKNLRCGSPCASPRSGSEA